MSKNVRAEEIRAAQVQAASAMFGLLMATVATQEDEAVIALLESGEHPALEAFVNAADAMVDTIAAQGRLIAELAEISSFTSDPDDADLLEKKRAAQDAGKEHILAGGTFDDLTPEHQALFTYMLALEAKLASVPQTDEDVVDATVTD